MRKLSLKSDTDAKLHKERVTTRRNENILETCCRRDDEECAENCSDDTSAKISTGGPNADSQQSSEHVGVRPQAESSTVVRFTVGA